MASRDPVPNPPGAAPPGTDRPERLPPWWEDLSPLGRLVVTAGALVRVAGTVADATMTRAARIAADSAQAYREGRDGAGEGDARTKARGPDHGP